MHKLRRLLESWMNIEPAAAGEDTRWEWRYFLGWPDWVVVLFLVFAVIVVVSVYQREGRFASRWIKGVLAGVRLGVVALLLLMLGELEIGIDRTGLPFLVMMLDTSESMAEKDRLAAGGDSALWGGPPTGPSVSRLERVQAFLRRHESELADLTAKHKWQLHAHASAPSLVASAIDAGEVATMLTQTEALKADGQESRLGSNLRAVLNKLRGAPPSAVLLFTDGVTTDGETLLEAASQAARRRIPLFTIGVGDAEAPRDLQLQDLLVDEAVFVDDIVTFEAKLVGKGVEDAEVAIALREKGKPTVLDTKTYRVSAGQSSVKVRLAHRPTTPGQIVYELEAPALEREVKISNNRLEQTVRVVKEKIRVLYVEAYPRFEFRYLKNLLERETSVDLKVLLLDSDPEYVQQDRAALSFFPTSKQELLEYDVLILGDVAPTLLSQAQLINIRDFVKERGGGFVLLAGKQFAPQTYRDTVLEELLPIHIGAMANRNVASSSTEGFQPRLTIEGRASPIFRFAADDDENQKIWSSLPRMFWYARVEKAKPGAQVLAEHPTDEKDGRAAPLVATQFYGAGRSYFQAFDGSWRWRYRVEDLYHSRYWIQVTRFMSRSKLLGNQRGVELLVEPRQGRRGDPVSLRLRFLTETLTPREGDQLAVRVEHVGHGVNVVPMQRSPGHRDVFEGVFHQTDDGQYRARLADPLADGSAGPTAEFEVVPPPGETDRVQMNESELRRVAELTGGKYYPLAEADALWRQLPEGRPVALHTDAPFPLWRTTPMLMLFFSLLMIEWVARKGLKMV